MLGFLKAVPWQVWVAGALIAGFGVWLAEHDRTVKLRAELDLYKPQIEAQAEVVDSLQQKLEADSVKWEQVLTASAAAIDSLSVRDTAAVHDQLVAAGTTDSLVAQLAAEVPDRLKPVVAALKPAIVAERKTAAERLRIKDSQLVLAQTQVSTLRGMVAAEKELRVELQLENTLLTQQLERAYASLEPSFFEKVSNHPATKLALVGAGYGLGRL
jgi:hypothetical protein